MAGHVAIVGGGFSGTMLAAQLVRAGAGRVTLIERGEEPGRGLAYGAADPIHVLNVRAGNMSAWPDEPGHFARWLEERGVDGAAGSFAPRRLFGRYVQDQLAGTAGVTIVRGEARDLELLDGGVRIQLNGRDPIQADAAVLAVGNLPPALPPGLDLEALPPRSYHLDPWAGDVAEGLGPDDGVLVIGTGLTMVDMVLLLDERGFTGPILALSRRGLLPHAHAPGTHPGAKLVGAPDERGSGLIREVRQRGAAVGWRHAVDELRPFTQEMWRGATEAERRQFLRHLRPWWDVHRHRIAPEVHARVQAMIARGQLRVAAGKLSWAQAEGGGALVRWRPRGDDRLETFQAARIVNCIGPEGNLPHSTEPLLHRLLARGTIRPGPCGIGIDIDSEMRAVPADGAPNDRLRAVGPMTRGALWEIVAVPDIRVQVQDVARDLASSL